PSSTSQHRRASMSAPSLPRSAFASWFDSIRRLTGDSDTRQVETLNRYSLLHVVAIWAAAALPMGILGWIVAPALAPDITSSPVAAVLIRYGALTLGLIWMFVLSLILVYREEGDVRWATLRRHLRLNT